MDRTEFKKRMLSLKSYRENNPGKGYWDWKVELFEEGGILLPEIEVLGTYPRKQRVYDRANSSLANFIQRAKDINRNTIPDWKTHNAVATHKLSYAEDRGKYVVYPDVLEINGNLYDFTDPKNGHYRNRKYRWTDALDSAINRGDTLTFDRESDAKYFTEHYKEYYPSFDEGGELSDDDKIIINRAWAKKVIRDAEAAIEMERGTRHIEPMPLRSFSELLEDSERRREQARRESGIEGLKNIVRGFNRTAGTAASLASLIAGGGWALTRLLSGNRATSLGRILAPGVIPANTADTAADAVDFAVDPSLSGAAEVGAGIVLGKWKNFGSKARQATELAGLYLNANNAIESYFEGGEVPPSDYQGSNEPARVNPITGKPLANGVVYTTIPPTLGDIEEPSAAIETALSFIPYIGDVMSVRDAYIAAKNKDLLGLGLAGLGLIPFVPRIGRARVKTDRPSIPTVNKDAIQRLIDLSVSQTDKNKKVLDDFYDLRNRVYESLIENEDAFKRAARVDRRSGTSYMLTYLDMVREYGRDGSNLNPNLAQPGYDRSLYEQPVKAQVSTSNPDLIRLNPRYKDPEELDETFLSLNPGLIRHEMGHSADIKSGLGYTKSLADPSKFEPESKIKEMYPKSYKTILDYLLNGSEIKSHMNEFRDFLFNKGEYLPRETINSIRKKLDKYGSLFKNLNILFDLYKNKRLFVNDYNLIPITATENNDNLV